MFSDALIALLFALGGGAWIYAKLIKQSGGNKRSAMIGTVISAGIIFLVAVTLLGLILKPKA